MSRDLVDRLIPFAHGLGVALDPHRADLLTAFVALLEAWNRRLPLTGDRSVESLVLKHCADSIAASSELPSGTRAVDVGSGAGFPGLVAACIRPDVDLLLVDSRRRSCGFLDHAAAELRLANVRVVCDRFESVAMAVDPVSTVLSRAVNVAPMASAIAGVLEPDGALVLMLAAKQAAPYRQLELAGFIGESIREYALPSGEARRIARYVRR